MKHFISCDDIDDLPKWIEKAKLLKQQPLIESALGKGKALTVLFFNPSLRTRISTIRAAQNLGLSIIETNPGKGWPLEFKKGAIMDADKSEHIQEAAAVIGQYTDILAVRCFANLEDREKDKQDEVIQAFVRYSRKPVINLESAYYHPLQGFADILTIEEKKSTYNPKIVLSWAPHPKSLPHAVANSFVKYCRLMNYDLTITHPPGYALDQEFTEGFTVTNNQKDAFRNADFIYTKNWCASDPYGKNLYQQRDWTIDTSKMAVTNNAYFMHCLPVRRNVVVTDEVLDSKNSIVFDQALNRVFSAQTVLHELLT